MKQTILVLFLLAYTGCRHPTSPPSPVEMYLISQDNAHDIDIVLTDFDKARITHQSGSSVRSKEFRKVGVGILDSAGYQELVVSDSTYDPVLDVFSFEFDFPLSLDIKEIETPIVVRYYHRESGFTDVDTIIFQYKYPYSRAEIFLTYIPTPLGGYFQDIDQIGNKFYFHPTGPEGLFEYDLSTKTTRSLVQYTSGDHIAADSIFVFCDVYHTSIRRYNLVTDTLDLILASMTEVFGLETYQGFLYALEGRSPTRLNKYTYGGTRVDSVLFPGTGYHLTINDGVLYTYTFSAFLRRIDLTSMAELPTVAKPASNLEGIRILDGRLYFCDFDKRMVGSVPLQDLK